MEYITPYKLTDHDKLHSLVEHRSKFNLDFCELNLFETHQQAEDFNLQFGGFTITSMLRGKKVMHLEGFDDFDYVPGETVIAPANTLMRIDFPDAEFGRPTQCTALVLDDHYLNRQLNLINSGWKGSGTSTSEWKIDTKELFIRNNRALARVSSKLLKLLTSDDKFKEYRADLMLRELVLEMLRLQNLSILRKEHGLDSNRSPFHAVLDFIGKQLSSDIKIAELCRVAGMSKSSFYRAFSEEYGITPVQLILEERLKYAKQLICDNSDLSIKEVAYASGFNDPNYFARAFRKQEGITPSFYKHTREGIN